MEIEGQIIPKDDKKVKLKGKRTSVVTSAHNNAKLAEITASMQKMREKFIQCLRDNDFDPILNLIEIERGCSTEDANFLRIKTDINRFLAREVLGPIPTVKATQTTHISLSEETAKDLKLKMQNMIASRAKEY